MMSRADAIAQLQSLRQEARAKAYPRSRLAIQEYMDAGTAAADAVALGMAIKALQAPARRRMPSGPVCCGVLLLLPLGRRA